MMATKKAIAKRKQAQMDRIESNQEKILDGIDKLLRAAPVAEKPVLSVSDLGDLPVSHDQQEGLFLAGYETADAVAKLSEDELVAVDGIGKATAKKIVEYFASGALGEDGTPQE